MALLEPRHIWPLPARDGRYRGFACDGVCFYLTLPQESNIQRLSMDMDPVECIHTARPYTCLCYDSKENCFWASCDHMIGRIFRLDSCFQETDCLNICGLRATLTGLSFDCNNGELLAALPLCILQIDKRTGQTISLQAAQGGTYTGVLSIAPHYVIAHISPGSQSIRLCSATGHTIRQYMLPADYRLEDMVFCSCCGFQKGRLSIYILAIKRGSGPCLLLCEMEVCGVTLHPCNFCCPPCPGKYDDEFDCKCRQECRCPPCNEKCRERCICDIIESVARVETSLAHILNAEGEKLQKAVQTANNVCELLEINRAVNKTITNITQLEQMLYAKLETARELELCPDTR